MNEHTLQTYGPTFQSKVITSLITDKNFILSVSDIISSKHFDSEADQWLVDKILDYFREYNDVPTLEIFKVEISEIGNDVLRANVTKKLKSAISSTGSPDLDYIKSKSATFFKNQKIKEAILESVDHLDAGEYEVIKRKIDDAMKSGMDKSVGLEYTDIDVESRYAEAARDTVSTPWDVINEVTDGGFAGGELVVFVAPAGIGKSWALVNVGAFGAKKGLSVVHYTMELNENYTAIRYDSVITGIPSQNLKYHKEDVQRHMNALKGELVIKKYPQNATSVDTLRAHLEKLKILDKLPDIIIVDYADLLRGYGKEKREQLSNVYVELRGLADEFGIPVFTASQANRSALDEEIIQADKIAEDYSKIMTADFVMSLSRKLNDKIAGTGRWHIIKNRFGPDGLTFPSKMNISTGKFDLYEEKSDKGIHVSKQSKAAEVQQRVELGQKYKEMKENRSKSVLG